MFGFFSRSEQEWRLRRLEENDKSMFRTLEKFEDNLKQQEERNQRIDENLKIVNQNMENDEKSKKELKSKLDKLFWLIITGVVGLIINYIRTLIQIKFGI
ncbi:hypothetical protein DOS62_06725 [Staphylococcus felis]|uniref:DUF2951 family protein n=1 Tax=Staphylococcus TaxID=1279 RepID=UPI000E27E503|nr:MULTISPECIES: DUF2951 family protein [Staphylococcus]REI04078.1 hypothetical protein DOS62_06725 [Staphylococcus felis]UXR79064.1 DUF2951 domain-containing protein [Staphylococcus sp. IVB6227]